LGWTQTACIVLARGSTAVADVTGVHQIALLASSGPETLLSRPRQLVCGISRRGDGGAALGAGVSQRGSAGSANRVGISQPGSSQQRGKRQPEVHRGGYTAAQGSLMRMTLGPGHPSSNLRSRCTPGARSAPDCSPSAAMLCWTAGCTCCQVTSARVTRLLQSFSGVCAVRLLQSSSTGGVCDSGLEHLYVTSRCRQDGTAHSNMIFASNGQG